jgi:hypothetical protein
MNLAIATSAMVKSEWALALNERKKPAHNNRVVSMAR